MENPVCENKSCGKEFVPSRRWQKFCTEKCRNDHWSEIRRLSIELYQKTVSA